MARRLLSLLHLEGQEASMGALMPVVRKRFSTPSSHQRDGTIRALIGVVLKEAKKKENRSFLWRFIWIGVVVFSLMLTAISLLSCHLIFGTWLPGIFIATILWAAVFGIGILFFLPSRFVTATFGSLLAISANQICSGAGLISEADKALTDIAVQIGIIAGVEATDPTIHLLLWVFVTVLTLICLPAFFSE